MRTEQQPIQRGFAVVRLMLDAQGIRTVPVGVVAWDADNKWYQVRVLEDDERVTGIAPHFRVLLSTAFRNMNRWGDRQSVGGVGEQLNPSEGTFWDIARERMVSAVRLDPAKALEPTPHPDMGIDTLFEAIVQPTRKLSAQRKRIDGAISEALGSLGKELHGRFEVRAFKGVRESVLRAALGDDGMVIVEGVNLAASTARRDADALVSKLLRIKAGGHTKTKFIIGYLASPGGLNGERHMKEWMQEQVSDDVYDLNTERKRFREKTRAVIDQGGKTLRMI